MSTKWDDNYWWKEFLEMKFYSPSGLKLLMEGEKGFKDSWRLDYLHQGYKRLKKTQELQQKQ